MKRAAALLRDDPIIMFSEKTTYQSASHVTELMLSGLLAPRTV